MVSWIEGRSEIVYLPPSAITLSLRFTYSRVKIDHDIYVFNQVKYLFEETNIA